MNEKAALVMLKVLKSIIGIFTGSFLVMYFQKISNNNIITTATYYVIVYFIVALFIFLFRNHTKGKNKMNLIRLGIIFNFVFILSIALLKEQLSNYIWIAGFLYGFSEAAYYSTSNVLESEIISNQERSKFTGYVHSLNDIIAIIIPILLGSTLSIISYDKIAIVILLLVIVQLFFTFQIKNKTNILEKCHMKDFFKAIQKKKNKNVRMLLNIQLLWGITFSGAFATTITLFTIRIFKTNLNLGIITSVFALIGVITSFIFGKYIQRKHYRSLLSYTSILTIICLIGIVINPSPLTIILYNFCNVFSIRLLTLMNELSVMNVANQHGIEQFRVEYLVMRENYLGLGRVISYFLLLFVGLFIDLPLLNGLLAFFILVIILLIVSTLRFEEEVKKHKEV